nr:hypothetical protein [Enterovibrio nigricans]
MRLIREQQEPLDAMSTNVEEREAFQREQRLIRRWDVIIALLLVFDIGLIAWDWMYLAQ